MPRTDVNIYKRKDGRWEGRYIKGRRNGKAWYGAVYAHSYQEVKVKLGIAKEALARDAARASAGTVSAVGEAWLSEAAVSLKDSSLNKYEDILRCYIIPHFGDCELSDITNEQLMGFGNALLTEGGANSQGLSASTVREVMSAMNSLRIHALRRDCSVSFTTECVNIKRDTEEIRVFTLQEEERLVVWLCGHFDLTAMVILLCLFTGIRVGEACALTWDDFDFGQGVFHVRKTMQRIRIKGDPEKKTEVRIIEPKSDCSVRTIPENKPDEIAVIDINDRSVKELVNIWEELPNVSEQINEIKVTDDGQIIGIVRYKKIAFIFDTKTKNTRLLLDKTNNGRRWNTIDCIQGQLFINGPESKEIEIYDFETLDLIKRVKIPFIKTRINSICDKLIIDATAVDDFLIFDAKNSVMKNIDTQEIGSIAFDREYMTGAVAEYDGKVIYHDRRRSSLLIIDADVLEIRKLEISEKEMERMKNTIATEMKEKTFFEPENSIVGLKEFINVII